jgi:hypothetical protein
MVKTTKLFAIFAQSDKANHVYLLSFSSSVSLEVETATLRVLQQVLLPQKRYKIKPSLPWLAWLFSKKKTAQTKSSVFHSTFHVSLFACLISRIFSVNK